MSRDLGAVTTFDDVLVGGQGQDDIGHDDDAAAHSTTPTTPLVLPTHSDSVQVYAMEMDISEPVGVLKVRAGEALHLKMANFTVWVLSEHRLSDTETLQEQCGTESGMVQVQFMVKGGQADGRIDIIDVLKPNEGDAVEGNNKGKSDEDASSSTAITATTAPVSTMATTATTTKAKPKTTRWIVCPTFKELQRVLKIPQDPQEWTCGHVRQWLSWAICQFGLTEIDTGRWNMTGRQLLALSLTDFRTLAPTDPGDIFYMHFELLRRTSVVAVVCDPHSLVPRPARPKLMCRPCSPSPSITATTTITPSVNKSMGGRDAAMRSVGLGGSGGGGGGGQQIQLWQFLLELLTDPKVSSIISWYGDDGQFRLHQPEVVASLWGQRKSKPNMNYEKLSRALRYYYDGEMIAKVSGKRFVYRFVLDLRSVLGYSADQLKHMVEQCHEKDV